MNFNLQAHQESLENLISVLPNSLKSSFALMKKAETKDGALRCLPNVFEELKRSELTLSYDQELEKEVEAREKLLQQKISCALDFCKDRIKLIASSPFGRSSKINKLLTEALSFLNDDQMGYACWYNPFNHPFFWILDRLLEMSSMIAGAGPHSCLEGLTALATKIGPDNKEIPFISSKCISSLDLEKIFEKEINKPLFEEDGIFVVNDDQQANFIDQLGHGVVWFEVRHVKKFPEKNTVINQKVWVHFHSSWFFATFPRSRHSLSSSSKAIRPPFARRIPLNRYDCSLGFYSQ